MILEQENARQKIGDSLRNADKVLVGIGTEFEQTENTAGEMQRTAYKNLRGLLEGKDYFIVSLCMDDLIYTAFDREERVVCPCGSRRMIQCADACIKEIYAARERCPEIIPLLEEGRWEEAESMLPACPNCQKPMTYQTIHAENYIEEGYLPQWSKYKSWLQTTINRKLCILEFGVGMQFPSVIRWAFDKLAYYNQKAEFYRIHDSLYQHTEENGERGFSVKENGLVFLSNLQ